MDLWVLSVLFGCQLSAAGAEPLPGAEPSPGDLLRRNVLLRFEVAGGQVTCPSLSRYSSRNLTADHAGIKESLSIHTDGNEPSLSYRYASPDRQWAFDIHATGSVTLRDEAKGELVVYEQRPGAGVTLTIENSQLPKYTIKARSLWHLLAFSPEGEALLIPQLQALRADWSLMKQVAETRELLLKSDERQWRHERATWQRCLAQLGEADYDVRQAADRRLRDGGCAAVGYLRRLDVGQLEPEQCRRVKRIIAATHLDVDEPHSVAADWAYDAEVWCNLLRDEAAPRRSIAAAHLAHLLGRPLVFDPAADDATRSAQARSIEDSLIRR